MGEIDRHSPSSYGGSIARPETRAVRKDLFFNQTSVLSLANQLVGDFTPPFVSIAREETLRRLQKVLEELEPIDREIIALRHGEQLSRIEVATVLNIPIATAAKRYVRALSRLRQRMEGTDE